MDLQDQAAQDLAHALVERKMGAAIAFGSEGPVVSVQEHPEAAVHFKRDQLGGLLVMFVFDGRPPVRLDYLPTHAGTAQIADMVIENIAGRGGGSAT